MQKWQVGVSNDSFNNIGVTKDCQEAICEYIWNGLEANATEITVTMLGEHLRESPAIQISDNGDGINFDTLKDTFGTFSSSTKNGKGIRIKSQANKGRGRFSYSSFSSGATWTTRYRAEDTVKEYALSISLNERDTFSTTDVINASISDTGTTVEMSVVSSSEISKLSAENMKQKLLQEFSWFLHLHKSKKIKIVYMGIELDYNEHIDTELSSDSTITISDNTFNLNVIVWNQKIDNTAKTYFLRPSGELCYAENTGYNKNKIDFYHSVFVTSDFITNHTILAMPSNDSSNEIADDSNARETFLDLKKELQAKIAEIQKKFLLNRADIELQKMKDRNTWPSFPDDEYGQLRKKDFQIVATELYCVEPRIFRKLKVEQEKSLLGFMNLLLASDERENILEIIQQVVHLSTEQRERFADILKRTKIQYILEMMDLLDKRNTVVQYLKSIVYDFSKFSNERDHLQVTVEQHFWLFGEQYHLLTADKTLASSLREYEVLTDTGSDSEMVDSKAMKKRADIFLYTQRIQEDSTSEMLILELKAPSVKLSTKVYNQIESYVHTIRKEPRFNSGQRQWRVYAICAEVEDDVKVKYDNFKQHGKKGLVNIIQNFEMYALSWDDVFQSFDARHSFLLRKLQLDTESLGLSSTNQTPRELVNEMTKKIIALKAD